MKTFLLPTGDDPEINGQEETPAKKQAAEQNTVIHQDVWDQYTDRIRRIKAPVMVTKIDQFIQKNKTLAAVQNAIIRMDEIIAEQDLPF